MVAAITRTIPARPYPFVVVIAPGESGLPDESAVNCAQMATIQKDGPASRLRAPRGEGEVRPIGYLGFAKMAEVDAALKYNLHPDPDEGGYWVTVPALPGCYSQDDTRDETIAHAREAIQLYIEDMVDSGEPVPEERERPEALVVEVAA